MKKLTLALVLAVSCANVNAMIVSPEADIESRIQTAEAFNDAQKNCVISWVKDHKAAVSVALLLVAGAAAYGIDRQWNEGAYSTAVSNFVANHGGTWTKTKANEWIVNPADAYIIAPAKANPKPAVAITAGSVVTAIAIIAAIYDLRKDADKSQLKALYARLTAKAQAEEAPVAA